MDIGCGDPSRSPIRHRLTFISGLTSKKPMPELRFTLSQRRTGPFARHASTTSLGMIGLRSHR